jgi:Ca2+-dependent lipid-binding protein
VIELPEDAILEIEVWDYDTILGDDFIGSAIIDLENRAFYQ